MQSGEKPRRRRTAAATQIRAQQLRQEQTIAEAKLWYHLRDRRLDGFRFRRQHPIGRFIVDFCCPEHHLIVEIDGPIHQEQIEYDIARADVLRAAGYVVVRYTNDAVQQRIDEVLADLRRALTSDDHTALTPSPAAAGAGDGDDYTAASPASAAAGAGTGDDHTALTPSPAAAGEGDGG